MGVDVRSHQDGPPIPFSAVVQGNEAVDSLCDMARALRCPSDVHIPTGGQMAFFTFGGRMVTQPCKKLIRSLLRHSRLRKLGGLDLSRVRLLAWVHRCIRPV